MGEGQQGPRQRPELCSTCETREQAEVPEDIGCGPPGKRCSNRAKSFIWQMLDWYRRRQKRGRGRRLRGDAALEDPGGCCAGQASTLHTQITIILKSLWELFWGMQYMQECLFKKAQNRRGCPV